MSKFIKKKSFFVIFGIVLVLIIGISLFQHGTNRDSVQMTDLILLERGLKITAGKEDVEAFIEAYKKGESADVLDKMIEDFYLKPGCIITEIR